MCNPEDTGRLTQSDVPTARDPQSGLTRRDRRIGSLRASVCQGPAREPGRHHLEWEWQRTAFDIGDLGEYELEGQRDPIRLYTAKLAEEVETTPTRELLQEAIAPLQLLDVEGMGGMGEIYLARDPGLRRTLAVKVLRSELVADRGARSRFQREATVIAGLSHPNVITIHTVGELEDETPYFVMDYIEGGSLADRLKNEGPLPVPGTRRIIGEVASALQAAHAKGVVHRDITAANVLWDLESERALVTDWGIAALDPSIELAPETRLTGTGMFIGSPHYMSPEQLAGDEMGPETDIYGLGLLAYELLTGDGPFPGETPREVMISHLRETPPKVSESRGDVDSELADLIERCLKKEPRTRPTAEEIVGLLRPEEGRRVEWPPPDKVLLSQNPTECFADNEPSPEGMRRERRGLSSGFGGAAPAHRR